MARLAAAMSDPTPTPMHAKGAPMRADGFVLPSGRSFDPHRSRWQGLLDEEELAFCRQHGIPVAYDCLQLGWVPVTCADAAPVVSQGATPVAASAAGAAAAIVDELRRLARGEGQRAGAGGDEFARETARVAVRQHVAPGLAALFAAHGLRAADECHQACEVALHQELPAPAPLVATEPAAFTFRAWLPDDAEVYRTLLDDPELWEFLPEPFPSPLTAETASVLLAVGTIEGKQETLAVELDGRPIGQCLLRLGAPFAGGRAAEVAYWLGREHQGKGLMPRILGHFLLHAFRRHAIDVVFAWIREDHRASMRVAERCGFARDPFPYERELAAMLKKDRFRRFATYRSAWPLEQARSVLLR